MIEVAVAVALGFGAGMMAGLFGVGGGIVFVPTLALGLGLAQVDAEATSLLASLPAVAVGTWQQRRYGNVRWRPALVVGLGAVPTVIAGAMLALALDETWLRRLFGLLLLAVAAQLVARSCRRDTYAARDAGT